MMNYRFLPATLCWIGLVTVTASAAADEANSPVTPQMLREELQQLRSEYEARITQLEQRLSAAERASAESAMAPDVGSGGSAISDKAYNPAISLILNGRFETHSFDESTRDIPGFQLGGEAGAWDQGLLLGESELNLQANIDDKFFASATLALESEDGETGVALEEAFLQTLALPAGFTLKAGQFYSGVGYLNGMHPHATSFLGDPLPYRTMFGGRLADAGVQLNWTAPTILYTQLGLEVLAGNSFPGVGAAHNGRGIWTAFAKLGGDFNDSNSWLASLSYVSADAIERDSGGTTADSGTDALFTGDSNTWMGSLVWKWAPYGNPRERAFRFTAEYLARTEQGSLDLAGVTGSYDGDQRGYYVESVYRFHPQWSIGARYDTVSSNNLVTGLAVPIPLGDSSYDPKRISAMVDFWNSEFSIIRFQYTRDKSTPTTDNQFMVQYIMSMGAHGGHSF